MSKYEVLSLLWSPSKNRYIEVGESIELGDEIAKILLNKQAIRPARVKIPRRAYKPYKCEELKDGTND